MASLQKGSHFYVHDKTIHSLAKYIIMNYFDREGEKSRHLLVQPKATGMLLAIWCHAFTSFDVGFSE